MRADLALIGFGNVARAFVALLDERRRILEATYDLHCRVVSITTARHGAVWDDAGVDTATAVRIVESGAILDGAA